MMMLERYKYIHPNRYVDESDMHYYRLGFLHELKYSSNDVVKSPTKLTMIKIIIVERFIKEPCNVG